MAKNEDGDRPRALIFGLGTGGFLVELVDNFIKDGFAGLVAIDTDEEAEVSVMEDDGKGLFAEFVETSAEGGDVLVVFAGAAVA